MPRAMPGLRSHRNSVVHALCRSGLLQEERLPLSADTEYKELQPGFATGCLAEDSQKGSELLLAK